MAIIFQNDSFRLKSCARISLWSLCTMYTVMSQLVSLQCENIEHQNLMVSFNHLPLSSVYFVQGFIIFFLSLPKDSLCQVYSQYRYVCDFVRF